VETSENIQTVVAHNPRDESHVTNSFKIMLNVKNFASNKVSSGDDVDLIISIYEASEGRTPKPLFENYIVENWNRNSKDLDKRTNNLRVLFGDISKNDITDKRLFLICNVVSNGNFSSKNGQSNINSSNEAIKTFNFRKPVGVAAHEITSLFTFKQGKTTYKGAETELACPFLFSNDSETLESTFRKLVFEKKANVESKVFWVNIGIIFGDVSAITAVSAHQTNSISEHCLMANSHNYGGRVAIARKLGLPDVILPSDVRNDLYINIYYGELSRLEKMQDRNIEVTTEVCDAKGQIVRASVSLGVGSELKANFTSLVYYHEGKPRWNEVVRVTLPADQFAICHLRFTFRHRSRRNEKSIPWAMAFMKLVSDHDGTAVKDQVHDLLVYKIEKRVDVENTSFYLSMPHLKSGSQSKSKTLNGLTPLPKDVFHIQTTLASTKLTQNEGLLSLLKWKSEPDRLAGSLSIFDRKVTAQEFVKFMPDVLDALFSMLMENSEAEVYDNKVFKSLVNVLLLITEEKSKFKQFIPVLELYINENFYATLAYNKLLVVLKECVDNATTKPKDLIEAMKCLRYVFKFVVRSRMLFSDLNDGKGQEPFEQLLKDVLMSLVKLMFYKSNDLYMAQGHCLKNTILAVPDLIKIFDDKTLSEILIQMVTSLPNGQLDTTKVNTIKELVHCPLFGLAHCRAILLPAMASKVKDLTTDNIELVPMVTETLGDILDELTRLSPSYEDISELMLTCLRTVIQSVANRKKNDNNIKAVVANMICLLHSMNPKHYDHYINHFEVETPAGRSNLIDFIMEVLGMFRDLVENNVFPKDWNTMIMLQNSVIMKALCQFAHTIRDYFTSSPNFELTAWRNFFKCAITFIKQPSLQLDKFSENKRLKMLKHYGDMRKTMVRKYRRCAVC
jgi:dedicator of cytokinesis protein 1